MFFITYLKLYLSFNIDFYKWFIFAKSFSVYIKSDINIYKNYKIEYLLNWHIYCKRKGKIIKYLI